MQEVNGLEIRVQDPNPAKSMKRVLEHDPKGRHPVYDKSDESFMANNPLDQFQTEETCDAVEKSPRKVI